MKKFISLITTCVFITGLNAQCSELFFSEYIEGSSSNKAFEVYNPTSSNIDLTDYVIYRNNNGSIFPTDSLFPVGMLAPDDVYIVANPGAIASITSQADTLHTMTFYNGDDALWIKKISTGDTLDIIGEIGVDPGSGWPVGTGATNNFTLIRQIGIQQGETNWSISSTQWDVYPIDMVDSLGFHTMTPCATSSQCPEPFFSEYIEGSSSNKAFEIYNPSNANIDLTDYVIYRNNNGATIPSDSLFPVGMLAPDDVFVVANPGAIPSIIAQADTIHTMTFYNGDDALWIKKISTGDTLDIIGEIGVDPGSGWTVGTGATNNHTLIRQISVQQGETNWPLSSTQWDVYPIDMVDSLGMHSMIPCLSCAPTSSSIIVTECDSFVSPSGNYIWTVSNTYMDTIPNAASCDSVITIALTINNSTSSTLNIVACDSFVSPSGNYTWTTSNTYMDTIPNAASCDSIITVNLTINNSTSSTLNIAACDSFVSPSGNYIWTSSNTYMDTIPNMASCDSVITINLTITSIITTVTPSGNTLSADQTGASYQWLDCDNSFSPLSGETGQLFSPSVNGNYAVEITLNGCIDTSNCNPIVGLDILNNSFGDELSVYPNPTLENFTIQLDNKYEHITVRILGLNGTLVKTRSFSNASQLNMKIEGAKGQYIVEIIADKNKKARIKVLKQ